MEDRSSRTPEGVPHRCHVCGKSFRIEPSLSGDACCPDCNSLVWPVENELANHGTSYETLEQRDVKEVRLRPRMAPKDKAFKYRQARRYLTNKRPVRIVLHCRGREMAQVAKHEQLLNQFVSKLVQRSGRIVDPPRRIGRKVVCVVSPS